VLEEDAGAGSASHSEPRRAGYGSEALGLEAGGARREECQEAGHRGGGAAAGDSAASVVGDGGSVRAPGLRPGASGRGLIGKRVCERRVWATARSRRNGSPATGRQFDTEM